MLAGLACQDLTQGLAARVLAARIRAGSGKTMLGGHIERIGRDSGKFAQFDDRQAALDEPLPDGSLATSEELGCFPDRQERFHAVLSLGID